MIDDLLRLPKEKIMEPLARAMPAVSPSVVTAGACLVGVASAVAASQQAYGLALGLWGLNRLLDGLDGTMARLRGQQSDWGGYLDIVLDMVVYSAIPFGLAWGSSNPNAPWVLALLLVAFYVNSATWMYLSSLLEKRNLGASARGQLTTVTIPSGLIEGLETFVFYTVFLLFPGQMVFLFGLMAVLVGVTAVQRVVWAAGILRHPVGKNLIEKE